MAETDPNNNKDSESESVDADESEETSYKPNAVTATTTTQPQPPPHASHVPLYHHGYPPPHAHGPPAYGSAGPYSVAVGKQYPPPPPPPPPHPTQSFQPPAGSNNHAHAPSSRHDYHRPIPLRAHETDYRGHPPPPPNAYNPPPIYPGPPEERRWLGPSDVANGQPSHVYSGYDGHGHGQHYEYGKPLSSQSFPPAPSAPPSHLPYHYPHPAYPGSNNRLDDNSRIHPHEVVPGASDSATANNDDVDGREGATSPSQIEMSHRDEVTNMGCTCKKTKCLKLYCQCLGAKIFCGSNCRCTTCFNTKKHEKQRNDAMRIILSRNPTAFDTKFSKTKERKAKEQQLVLAHKLGCKCRKSACMKKYCECFAGSVKCSSNCRCIGCKNTQSGNPDQDKPQGGGALLPSFETSVQHGQRGGGREPWMMNAAQNLAFLKHGGSPSTVEKPVAVVHDAGDAASMPSLAASSSDTSPGEKHGDATKGVSAAQNKDDPNSSTVDSLLMAAMAMTEFQSQNTTDLPTKDVKEEEGQPPNTKPNNAKGLRPSPKRKSTEIPQPNDAPDHPVSVEPADVHTTPLDPRDLKRTRLGSVCKKMTWPESEESEATGATPENATEGESTMTHETPHQQKPAGTSKLTPISARCIDFKRMHVDENKDPGQP